MENDDVTVLLVWNGPGVSQKWQLTSVLRALKRERGEDSDGEEGDEEVGEGAIVKRRNVQDYAVESGT